VTKLVFVELQGKSKLSSSGVNLSIILDHVAGPHCFEDRYCGGEGGGEEVVSARTTSVQR
jgi:hypothetical protein